MHLKALRFYLYCSETIIGEKGEEMDKISHRRQLLAILGYSEELLYYVLAFVMSFIFYELGNGGNCRSP